MIEIIAGEKGKGKTKHLLDKVNRTVKTAKGRHRVSGQKSETYV